MIEQLQRHVFCWCLFMACYLHHNAVIGKVFPSIIWSPYNPLFSCEEPTLNVRVDDIVKFICPYYDVGFVQPEDSLDKPLYENMYLVKEDRNAFDQCDASGSGSDEQILKCDQLPSSANSNRLRFIKTQTFPGQMYYEEGKSYYFIGTGYRTAENVNNTIGGSCNTTENEFQYKLRLKVYICRQDEVCRTCNTAQCYSKECHCSPWVRNGFNVTDDFSSLSQTYQRRCKAPNENARYESKTIDSVSLNSCTEWKKHSNETCNFMNTPSNIDCPLLFVKTCQSSIASYSFCKYVPDFSNCHCSDWIAKERKVAPDFSAIHQIFERTCSSSYNNSTRIESKETQNATIHSCQDWEKPDDKLEMNSCLFINNNTLALNSACASIELKRCSSSMQNINICRYIDKKCPTCTQWSKTSYYNISSDLKVKAENFLSICPNGTINEKSENINCVLDCSSWQKVEPDSHCDQYENQKPDCFENKQKRSCSSVNCQFNLSICKYIGVTCPHCNPWSEIEKTPSADFTQLSLNETRWCRDGNDNKTEFKQRDCDLQCEDWKEFDEEQDEGCIILNGNTTTTPKKDNQLCGMTSKRCQSNQCNKEINFCAFSTCTTSKPTTRSQSGTPEVEKQVGPGEAKESNKFLYISIPMFLVLFALGILVGILAFKRYHQKKCLNFIMRPNQVDVGEERGNVNLAYQSSVIEKRPNAQSVYYANESDSVHCDTFDEESKS
ncbi:uncharacterized protein [Clytia hemisphaerica]